MLSDYKEVWRRTFPKQQACKAGGSSSNIPDEEEVNEVFLFPSVLTSIFQFNLLLQAYQRLVQQDAEDENQDAKNLLKLAEESMKTLDLFTEEDVFEARKTAARLIMAEAKVEEVCFSFSWSIVFIQLGCLLCPLFRSSQSLQMQTRSQMLSFKW